MATLMLDRFRAGNYGFVIKAPRLIALAMAFGIVGCAQETGSSYLTGMTLSGPVGCPVFVDGITSGSPAERAGIQVGDQVLRVDGTPVNNLEQAAGLLRSDRPKPVGLTLGRAGKEVRTVSQRQKQSVIFANAGKKMISGIAVPFDATQAEIAQTLNVQSRRIIRRVFPSHYPLNPEVFYGGFEIFILRDPAQVTVGGIEDGPAANAGVHWGDALISVNGTPISGKTDAQLEALFSANEPATMHLQVNRAGSLRTFDFHLDRAGEIARKNGKRFVDGQLVPSWASDEYLHCFLRPSRGSNPR